MHTAYLDYHLGALTMEGFMAYQDGATKRPLVIIVHDWSGCREFAQSKAHYFAEQGFVGFAIDLYGKNQRGSDTDKALNQQLMSELISNRANIILRIEAAIACAQQFPAVDKNKTMLVGFCLGGLCSLDFARSGAKVNGVVSVHGGLTPPPTSSNNKINSKILVIHGYLDKAGTPDVLNKFHQEMLASHADWQTLIFGQAMHAFTNPHAQEPNAGLQYDELSAQRTWKAIKAFSDEIFV